MIAIRLGTVIGLACVLQACAIDEPAALETPSFGNAVRANIAVQTVNPMAPTDRGPLLANGERAAVQQERYTTDTVEMPVDVGTLQGVGAGGAGGGGGGGGGNAAGGAAGIGAAAAP